MKMQLRKTDREKSGKKKIILVMITAMLCSFLLTACGDPKLKVNYSIDGKKTEELPSQGLYEIKSVKCNKMQ